jgi:hypothetical protein
LFAVISAKLADAEIPFATFSAVFAAIQTGAALY